MSFLCYGRETVLPTSYYFPFSELGGRAHLNVNYRLLPRVFRESESWIRIRNRSRRVFGEYYEFCSLISRRDTLRPSGFCSWSWGGFSICHFFRTIVRAIPLIPCFGVRTRDQSFSKLFGRLLTRSGSNMNNAHARMYTLIRIRDIVLSLIS